MPTYVALRRVLALFFITWALVGRQVWAGPSEPVFPGEALARARLDQHLETASGSELRVDVAVIRSRLGQYLEAVFGGR
jgi:hypothetical protein